MQEEPEGITPPEAGPHPDKVSTGSTRVTGMAPAGVWVERMGADEEGLLLLVIEALNRRIISPQWLEAYGRT